MTAKGSPDHRLLILGLLRMQEMHGYQIAETIETHFGDETHIKKPTLYDTLKRLHADGLVSSREEQEGNRPPRTVYAMTGEGEREFRELLRESVGTYREPDLYGDVALLFLEALPATEVRSLLLARRDSLSSVLTGLSTSHPHHGTLGVTTSRRDHHLNAERAWLDEVLAGLGGLASGERSE
jgi:DNA-binding PadR family transcriptional regulator